MKHKIKVGTDIIFLYGKRLTHGTCIKVNEKTFKVQPLKSPFVKNVKKDRVANTLDEFSLVWDCSKGVTGACRIDYDNYLTQNKTYNHWAWPNWYIIEN